MVRNTTKKSIIIPSIIVGFIGNDSVVPGKTIKFPYNWEKHIRYPRARPTNRPMDEIKMPSIKNMEKIFFLVSPMLNSEAMCFFFSTNNIVSDAIRLKAESINIKIKIQITIIFSD
jgi:hypothetical protein